MADTRKTPGRADAAVKSSPTSTRAKPAPGVPAALAGGSGGNLAALAGASAAQIGPASLADMAVRRMRELQTPEGKIDAAIARLGDLLAKYEAQIDKLSKRGPGRPVAARFAPVEDFAKNMRDLIVEVFADEGFVLRADTAPVEPAAIEARLDRMRGAILDGLEAVLKKAMEAASAPDVTKQRLKAKVRPKRKAS